MKLLGIIAEYNPFHKGHSYHIKEALKLSKADAVIVAMSGDFVQRGAPAIFPKHLRAKMALSEGASVVLELPVSYACGSAEFFARGAISLFNALGCIDSICFGSESGNLIALQNIAEILAKEPKEYREFLQQGLRTGLSYPLARQQAFQHYTQNDALTQILTTPNNILGIEYLKAMYLTGSPIQPYTIQRKGAGYHEDTLHETYSSASAIRSLLEESVQKTSLFSSANRLKGELPESSFQWMEEYLALHGPLFCDDFSLLLKYKLLNETKESLRAYVDVSPELANRICNHKNDFLNWTQFCDQLKTKELTFSRISRALLHILLDIRFYDQCSQIQMPPAIDCPYARILGFCEKDAWVLKECKKYSQIPLITKINSANDSLDEAGKQMLKQDLFAANLYESVVTDKFHTPFIEEHRQKLVILP